MPYKLERSGRGWYVITKDTRKRHSKRPLSRKRAVGQLRALYASYSGPRAHGRTQGRAPESREKKLKL